MADIKTNQNKNNTIYISGGNKSGNIEVTNNNAKYFSDKSLEYSNNAKESAEEAKQHAENAENSKNTILNDSGFIAVSNNLKTSDTIGTVANNIGNVNFVGENIEHINQLVDDLENLGDTTNISIVATNITGVNTTAKSITNVNKVANSISNVDNIANNLTEILNSSTYANNAKTSATSAQTSANNSLTYSNNASNSANLAQQWAVSSSKVENTDYSSKYYANQAKLSANIATEQATIATNKVKDAISIVDGTLNKTQITNCILSVEELVKVEPFAQTGSSLLRLKAGSIVYVSTNGTFNEVTIKSDVYEGSGGLHTSDSSRDLFCCYVPSTNKLITIPVNETYSQATAPTAFLAGKYAGWYDTTNKIMKYSYDAGVTWTICSLPFVVGNPKNVSDDGDYGWVNRIKQIFNGYGYVGQYTFTTRGLRYLIPNGRNTDKTLKNIEVTTTKLTLTGGSGLTSWIGFLREDGDLVTYGVDFYFEQNEMPSNLTNNYATWLNTDENIMYTTSNKGLTWTPIKQTLFGDLRKPNADGNITEIKPNKPVELVKLVDLDRVIKPLKTRYNATKAYITETYQSGTSWYRVWSDGWCEQGEYYSQAGATTYTRTFLKTYSVAPTVRVSPMMNANSDLLYKSLGYDVKTTGFSAYTGTVTDYISWYACGYIA